MAACTLTRRVLADPDLTLRTITDLPRLPEWNRVIRRVLETPDALTPGSEWVVEIAAMGQRWASRSRLSLLDEEGRRFEYRSMTDDGNPSYAEWAWAVTPTVEGCEVSVSWNVHPATFWRRLLFARIRRHQLRRTEVPASLIALQDALETTVARG